MSVDPIYRLNKGLTRVVIVCIEISNMFVMICNEVCIVILIVCNEVGKQFCNSLYWG